MTTKRKSPVFHTAHTIKAALGNIESGMSIAEVARKYGVHYGTAWNWTQNHRYKTTTITDTKTETVTLPDEVSITVILEQESLERLEEICKNEVRTLEQQVKYLVLEGMTRRNPIPF